MKRVVLCVALIAMVSGLSRAGYLDAQSGKKQATLVSKTTMANPADFVGSDTCAVCHADVAKKFDGTNPHSKLALEHGGKGVTCEGCHGPGKRSCGDSSRPWVRI